MTLEPGTKLGPYEITAPLGAGGMGEVYAARDTRLERDLALKILSAEMADDFEGLSRFEKEARLASALNHPNIVTVYDIGSSGKVRYIAMELVKGSTIRELLRDGALTLPQILDIAAQITEGLAKAHEAGIVHRDLKPENVMVTRDGLAKVLDFGLGKYDLSRLAANSCTTNASEGPLTMDGRILGTVDYMSPEQALGVAVDFRSDQFSFGSLLCEMVSGQRPFHRASAVQTLSAIIEASPQLPESLQLPGRMREIINRCLQKQPAQRYPSTRILASELRSVAKAPGENAAPHAQTEERSRAVRGTTRQNIQFCVTSDGARLAYASTGAGYPLVKAANWLNHLDYEWDSPLWKHWLAELTKHHRLIRYDERGNGLSQRDVKEMSFEQWVQDLEAVVAATRVDRFALMGISQGGPVAIAYAVRHPERVSHLVLMGSFSRGLMARGTEAQIAARRALQTLVRLDWGKNNPDFKAMFTRFYIPHGSTPDQQQWFNDLQQISATPEGAARLMTLIDEIDIRHLLSEVSVPTIIFHGTRDKVIPAEEGRILAAEIPNARFVPLNTGNHILLAQEPAWPVFLEELEAFLGSQSTRIKPLPRSQLIGTHERSGTFVGADEK
jgi:serine/threonine protein kinase/alpha-beta hydrolase superfamily lysophospholipase